MVTLVVLSILCIASYTAAVCIKNKGIPYSISETFYKLEHKAFFGISMLLTAGLLMPAILEATPENYQFLAFLSCVGMMIVAAAPNFKEEYEYNIHVFGAGLCIICSQLWVYFMCPWCLLVWVAYLAYTVWMMKKNWKGNFISAFLLTKPMFFVELSALFATYLTVFLEM